MQTQHLRPGLVLTRRDFEWIEWLDRVRYCTAGHLQRRFPGSSLGATRVRLSALKQGRLVVGRSQVGGGPRCWAVTVTGAAAVGSLLPRASWEPGRTAHTLSLAEAVSLWERAGHAVLTEAEIRCDARWLAMGAHRPDAVLSPHERPVAVEVERSRKSPSEWARLIGLYRRDPLYEGRVLWLAAPGVHQPVARVIAALGAGSTVRAMEWGTPAGTGTGAGTGLAA